MTDPSSTPDPVVAELIEYLRDEAQGIRDGHPCADQGLLNKAAAQLTALSERVAIMADALESIKRHCEPQPSALAKAIVATCDNALPPPPATNGETK